MSNGQSDTVSTEKITPSGKKWVAHRFVQTLVPIFGDWCEVDIQKNSAQNRSRSIEECFIDIGLSDVLKKQAQQGYE